MKKYLINVFLTTQLFAIGGFGVYGAHEVFSHEGNSSDASSGYYRFKSESFENSLGAGFFIYTDLLPFIDLEYSLELNAQKYQMSVDALLPIFEEGEKSDFAWAKTSSYFTARKQVFGVKIPFLAKASMNLGIGINNHKVMPELTPTLIENALGDVDLFDTEGYSLTQQDTDKIVEYILDNRDEYSGFHLQAGAHGRLLAFNLFINARYTIVDDVIKGQSGFPSIWTGLAIGI